MAEVDVHLKKWTVTEFVVAEGKKLTYIHVRLLDVFGEPVRIAGLRLSPRVLGARLCCICFVFLGGIIICPLYKLTIADQTEVTVQLGQSFRLSANTFNFDMIRP
jgi:hypothetical protein